MVACDFPAQAADAFDREGIMGARDVGVAVLVGWRLRGSVGYANVESGERFHTFAQPRRRLVWNLSFLRWAAGGTGRSSVLPERTEKTRWPKRQGANRPQYPLNIAK